MHPDVVLMRAWSGGDMHGATAALHDERIPLGTRHDMARQIGGTCGNATLQRILSPTVQRVTNGVLKQGSRGPAVTALQEKLAQRGAAITADGQFGPKTRQAVIGFQQAAGLGADGIVGPMTWAALEGGAVTAPPTQLGPDAVGANAVQLKLTEIQTYLRHLAKLASGAPATKPPSAPMGETKGPPAQVLHDDQDGEEKSWWDTITETASAVVGGVVDTATSAAEAVGEVAGQAWDTVTETASDVGKAAGKMWDTASETVGGAVRSIPGAVTKVVEQAGGALAKGVDAVAQGVSGVATEIGTTVDKIASDLGERFAAEIAGAKAIVDKVGYYLSNPGKALKELEQLLSDLKKKAEGIFGGAGAAGDDVYRCTVPPVIGTPQVLTCHDRQGAAAGECPHRHPAPSGSRPEPGTRRLRVNVNVETATEAGDGLPSGGTLVHDSCRPTLSYKPVTTAHDTDLVQVPADDFGSTATRIDIDNITAEAQRWTDFVTVNARLLHRTGWAVTRAATQKPIDATLYWLENGEPGENGVNNVPDAKTWKEAADDLDPDLYKSSLGAPRRKGFWAPDITQAHEEFHVQDGDKHVGDVVVPKVQADMASKTIDVPWILWRQTEVDAQVKSIALEASKKAIAWRAEYMSKPGVEQRAYAADEPKYRERAKRIRERARERWQ